MQNPGKWLSLRSHFKCNFHSLWSFSFCYRFRARNGYDFAFISKVPSCDFSVFNVCTLNLEGYERVSPNVSVSCNKFSLYNMYLFLYFNVSSLQLFSNHFVVWKVFKNLVCDNSALAPLTWQPKCLFHSQIFPRKMTELWQWPSGGVGGSRPTRTTTSAIATREIGSRAIQATESGWNIFVFSFGTSSFKVFPGEKGREKREKRGLPWLAFF